MSESMRAELEQRKQKLQDEVDNPKLSTGQKAGQGLSAVFWGGLTGSVIGDGINYLVNKKHLPEGKGFTSMMSPFVSFGKSENMAKVRRGALYFAYPAALIGTAVAYVVGSNSKKQKMSEEAGAKLEQVNASIQKVEGESLRREEEDLRRAKFDNEIKSEVSNFSHEGKVENLEHERGV